MGRHPCESCGDEGWDYSESYCPRAKHGCNYATDGIDICPDCMVYENCAVCDVKGCSNCVHDHKCICLTTGKSKDLVRCEKSLVCGKHCQASLEPVLFGCGHYQCVAREDDEEGDEGEEESKKPKDNVAERKLPENCSACTDMKASKEEYELLRKDAEILANRGDLKEIKSQVLSLSLSSLSLSSLSLSLSLSLSKKIFTSRWCWSYWVPSPRSSKLSLP